MVLITRDLLLRDELQYQTARINRENELMKQYNNHGITSNYPQYTTNFWGSSADNNYGFGTSNIGSNIENMQTTSQSQIQPKIWESASDGKKVYDDVVKIEGDYNPKNQGLIDYTASAINGTINLVNNYFPLKDLKVTDKYKHALMNCYASQYGKGGADVAKLASDVREFYDTTTGANTLDNSQGDQYANQIGRLLGSKYPNGDCDELIQRYIKKYY